MKCPAMIQRAFPIILVVILGWAAFTVFGLYRVYLPNRNHAMIPVLQDMQTFCVGRYLIDLPRGSTLSKAEASVGSSSVDFLTNHPISLAEFRNKVHARWSEIKDLRRDRDIVFTEPSQRSEVLPEGTVFTFRHHATDAREWPDGSKGRHFFYETEGYLWREETLYHFSAGSMKDSLIAAMHQLRPRKDETIPQTQGFCAGRSFFPGQPEDGESTNFVFHLPTTPLVEFRIGTMNEGLQKLNPADYSVPDLKMLLLRDTRHTIGDLTGEEWILSATGKNPGGIYNSSITAYWQRPAGESLSRQPSINLKLDLDIDEEARPANYGEFPPSNARGEIGKEEFLALWDGILKTLRPRPGAF